eukprot:6877148-Pyramimonas_sp.AAC.1
MEQRVPKAHATPERVLRLVYSHPCTAIGSCAGYIPIPALDGHVTSAPSAATWRAVNAARAAATSAGGRAKRSASVAACGHGMVSGAQRGR